MVPIPKEMYRFGQFELDVNAVELTRLGRNSSCNRSRSSCWSS